MNALKELWAYRQMVYSLVRKDLRGRYKGSVLGFLWTFINPLLQLVVYTLVFSVIMKNNIDRYYIYLFVVLVPWIFFSSSVTSGSSCILDSKDMVKKIYFPREVMPIACVTGNFVNMLLSFVVIFGVLIFTGWGVDPVALLCLPVIMVVEYILAMGIAMLASALTVYLRDLEYVLGIITMAWMYLTPVMYGPEQVPQQYEKLWSINPMTPIAIAYRDILYYKQVPQFGTLLHAFIVGVVILVLGYIIFRKLQKGFAEEL
ncbi:MAG: ABC transporter permease [Lachnospiraceae bacterium]